MKIRDMPLRQSSVSLIMKNNMVSIVDWHVVKRLYNNGPLSHSGQLIFSTADEIFGDFL